jgi:hypothetical protein
MTTRTLLGTIILIVSISAQSFAQSFHPTIRLQFAQRLNTLLDSLEVSRIVDSMEKSYILSSLESSHLLDSIETPHLRVNIRQPDKANMKFRIDVSNPIGRHAFITIRKKDDVYMSETIPGHVYVSMLDFSQMEDGDYQIIVAEGKERVCTNLTIHTETKVNRQAILH